MQPDCPTVRRMGLRHAAARRFAEAGCTAHEIAAITGHASLKEIVRYTKAADQRRLATAAMNKLHPTPLGTVEMARERNVTESVNPPSSTPKRIVNP